jgi:hypothetical protein
MEQVEMILTQPSAPAPPASYKYMPEDPAPAPVAAPAPAPAPAAVPPTRKSARSSSFLPEAVAPAPPSLPPRQPTPYPRDVDADLDLPVPPSHLPIPPVPVAAPAPAPARKPSLLSEILGFFRTVITILVIAAAIALCLRLRTCYLDNGSEAIKKNVLSFNTSTCEECPLGYTCFWGFRSIFNTSELATEL